MTQAMTVQGPSALPVLTLQESQDRYNGLVKFVKSVMKKDVDFGTIPGCHKNTLLKPGAEKLCTLFGLSVRIELLDSQEDWKAGFFYFRYRASLSRGDLHVASAEGSCNSRESKYRYRWVPTDKKPDKATADSLKAKGLGRWRKISGEWKWQDRADNDDTFSVVNTLQKMAQKRALVGATLIAANASEFFTQDIEDLDIIDVQADVVDPPGDVGGQGVHQTPQPAAPSAPPTTTPPPSGQAPRTNTRDDAVRGDTKAQATCRREIRNAIIAATPGATDEQRTAWVESLTAFTTKAGKSVRGQSLRNLSAGGVVDGKQKVGRLEVLHSRMKKGELSRDAFARWLDSKNAEAARAAQDAAADAAQEAPGEEDDCIPFEGGGAEPAENTASATADIPATPPAEISAMKGQIAMMLTGIALRARTDEQIIWQQAWHVLPGRRIVNLAVLLLRSDLVALWTALRERYVRPKLFPVEAESGA